MRPLTFIDGMTAAILHPKQLVLALIEFVIADGGDLKPHHRQRFDGRLIVKHRRQKRTGADQVSGRDKNSVFGALAELLDQGGHVLGAAGRDRDLSGLVAGIGDVDPARRRPKVAVKVVDGQNSQVNGGGLSRGAREWIKRNRQHHSGEDLEGVPRMLRSAKRCAADPGSMLF